jgi:hypothetical protein
MRATAFVIVAATIAAGATPLLAASESARMGFQDNKLNFKSCDGTKLTARWRDNSFHLSVPGKTLNPSSPELKLLGWDGSCQSISVDGGGRFKRAGEGADDASGIIDYRTWDDSKWAATRAGTDFFVVYVAGKDETASNKNLKEAAHWLRLRKDQTRAATRLAQELEAASGK